MRSRPSPERDALTAGGSSGNRWWVVGNCGAIGNHDRHRGRPDDNHGVAVAVSRSHRCTQANGKHSQHDDETFETSLLRS